MDTVEKGTAILKMTRDMLRNDDAWIKGLFRGDDGNCWCLVGALSEATAIISKGIDVEVGSYEETTGYSNASSRLKKVISETEGRPVAALTWWNDYESTTHQMVLDALDKAIVDV